MALDATVGGAASNSYLTVAEADDYFESRLHSGVWTAATASDGDLTDKESALIWATRLLDSKIVADWTKTSLPNDATVRVLTDIKPDKDCTVVWTGEPASATQALAWPRKSMKDKLGNDLATNVIPQAIKDAVCEIALRLLEEDRTAENAAAVQGLSELRAGPVTLKWRDGAPQTPVVPDYVFTLLVPSWWYAFKLEYMNLPKVRAL